MDKDLFKKLMDQVKEERANAVNAKLNDKVLIIDGL